ncbi:MAG: hypothetical protein J7M30_11705 [Deltaproteobacteria bacterium]|nr:hypothetical protein [Deltaproteobacteria bacterium]
MKHRAEQFASRIEDSVKKVPAMKAVIRQAIGGKKAAGKGFENLGGGGIICGTGY